MGRIVKAYETSGPEQVWINRVEHYLEVTSVREVIDSGLTVVRVVLTNAKTGNVLHDREHENKGPTYKTHRWIAGTLPYSIGWHHAIEILNGIRSRLVPYELCYVFAPTFPVPHYVYFKEKGNVVGASLTVGVHDVQSPEIKAGAIFQEEGKPVTPAAVSPVDKGRTIATVYLGAQCPEGVVQLHQSIVGVGKPFTQAVLNAHMKEVGTHNAAIF